MSKPESTVMPRPATAHIHKCMRCGVKFNCLLLDGCLAQESVMPRIVVPGPDGPQLFEHVCAGKVAAPALPASEMTPMPHGVAEMISNQQEPDDELRRAAAQALKAAARKLWRDAYQFDFPEMWP